MRKVPAALLACFVLVGATAHKHAEKPGPPIAIVIDGARLAVDPPPRFYKEHLLVPVRRIIAALGLDFVQHGSHVITDVGAKSIEMTIGSRIAQVDGAPVELEAAPVEIKGVLYAPLRFFTEALDAQAVYVRQTNSVEILSTLVGRSASGTILSHGGTEMVGTITALDLNSDPPSLTLTYNASVKTLSLLPDAGVAVQDVNTGTSNSGALTDIRAGDYARVYLDKGGSIKRIVDAYGSRSGTAAAIASGQLVLDDGHVISPSRTTTITLNGVPATLDQIEVGDTVLVRYNIDSSEPQQITATRKSTGENSPAGNVAVTSVQVSPLDPLRQGDTLRVRARGTPGGVATFDIGPYVTGLRLDETEPGVYTGRYVVPPGVDFSDAPVFVRLQVDDASAPAAESLGVVSIATQAPGIKDFAPDDGATVNDPRPSIYATFVTGSVPVDPSSAKIEVNGRDMTPESTRTRRFIQYTPGVEYRNGPVKITVRVSDEAGNTSTKTWVFLIKRGSTP